ncbi:anaerobic ribonucleoside-triphosphate reductase [Citrobacter koseri]|uniref:Anaerobic ribonucleoside-triphosphate reductase n=1 Tax=Citrobacter koseri TaxID=545 RepID=A0A2X2VBC3_CITKO|nr:anaerobic ribonucleoside-triphosphate reductase [Citrobacter koseri]
MKQRSGSYWTIAWCWRRKALMTRIARLEGVKARVAPILYMEGACGVRLKADDDVSGDFSKMAARPFRWAISVFTKPSTRCLATNICTTAKRCALKVSPLSNACVRRWTSGKTKPAMASACTARRARTCATASAVWIPLSLAFVPGVTDKGYYTNSFHLDVEKKVNPYDKIDFEAPYPPLASGWLHLLRRIPEHSAHT